MTMNPHLAAMYNTHGAGEAVQEEQEKIAHLELFAKVAAANGINLAELSSEDQQALYNEFTEKLAMEHEDEKKEEKKKDDEDEDSDKEAAARREFQLQKQAQAEMEQKVAEADFLGRTMAHAFWQESNAIEKEAAGKYQSVGQSLKRLGSDLKDAPGKAGKYLSDKRTKAMAEGAAEGASKAKKLKGGVAKYGPAAAGAAALGAGTAGQAAAAYKGGKAAKAKMDSKEASAGAFEKAAAEQAIKIASEAGWDSDEAHTLVEAVYTLGLESENTKVAQVSDYDDAVSVRGLEYLEAAGYPVNWAEVL